MAAKPPEPTQPAHTPTVTGTAPARAATETLREHVERILDLIRPTVQADDGDVELVEVSDEGLVRVRFHGACVGCPSSSITLQVGIERVLKQHIPEVKEVQSVA
ncbi:MAG: NifU family protein [Planctomycetota bacterium]|jgi:Fe-S cluster biogenesis protein NfuA